MALPTKSLVLISTVLMISSCSSLVEPNFYRMSEIELIAYNLTVAGPKQVACVQVQIDPNQESEKICGTLEEIQHSIEPVVPGAKINSMPFFSPLENEKSRSTNPPLRPTVRRPL